LWENQVGKSMAFWRGHYPRLMTLFPEALQGKSLEEFYRDINRVRPSLIRVEADEVTYHLHIMIRYEIERKIFSGGVTVKELPELWNQMYSDYLGIRPSNNREGILQDVHWSCGMFGYFPTYSLGSLYSVQIYNQAVREISDLEDHIERGELSVLREWLRAKIHVRGRELSADDLVKSVCGKGLSEGDFITYITYKFS